MKASQYFFENTDCPFFPCHDLEGPFNCLFCYCPLYFLPDCPGNYTFHEREGRRIKSCLDCDFPHRPENYQAVMEELRKAIKGGD